ncbi:unnamed protein product, partial [marine sediment metagenome]
ILSLFCFKLKFYLQKYILNNFYSYIIIISQDYDTLLFGAKRLLRNFAVTRSRKVGDTSITLDIEWILLPS